MKAAGDPFGLRHCDKSQSTPLTVIACDCHLRGTLGRRLFIYSKDESRTAAQKRCQRDSLACNYVHVHPAQEVISDCASVLKCAMFGKRRAKVVGCVDKLGASHHQPSCRGPSLTQAVICRAV